MPPGPGWRKCTVYRRPGPGGMSLALRLSDVVRRHCAEVRIDAERTRYRRRRASLTMNVS